MTATKSPAGRLPPKPAEKRTPRVRTSTRAKKPVANESAVRTIRHTPGVQRDDPPAPRLSTRVVSDNRTDRTIERRFGAPMTFFFVLFGVVVISVFAFGLLREVPEGLERIEANEPKPMHEVLKFENTPSSTNTGILRTSDD